MPPPFSSFSRTQDPRTQRPGMMRMLPKSFSLLPVLVLLMIVATAAASVACQKDSQCRRELCIFNFCASRPRTGDACQLDTHCFYTTTESCINSKCTTRSNPGGECDTPADCVVLNSVCPSGRCLSPSGTTCSLNNQCVSPLACISSKCSAQSPLEGTCDEASDCFSSTAVCEANKCLMPLDETCSKDSQCVSSLSCIGSKCTTRSNPGGTCDTPADCAVLNSVCPSGKCLSPSGTSCSLNAECASPLACISSKCSAKSPTGGDCDEASDCAKAGDTCSNLKCETPFVPSLMVWDGNKAPLNPGTATSSPSVVVDNVLFVFEGFNDGITPVKVEAYSPLTKNWVSKTGPGGISFYHTVVAVGKLVFLIGGRNSGSTYFTTFYSYNTMTDSWDKTWAQLPEARSFVAAAAVDNTMFIFGGLGISNTVLNTIISLDISTTGKAWTTLSPSAKLPTSNFALSATAFNKDIYLTGGHAGSAVKTVLKYNTLTPSISPSTNPNSMIQPREGHMSFLDPLTNRLYAVGGGAGSFQNFVEFLNLDTPSGLWESANALSAVASSTSGGLIGSLFHFVSTKTLQVLDVSVPSSVKWSPFPNSPASQASVVQMTSSNTITTVAENGHVAFYNTVSNTWSSGSSNFPGLSLSNTASAVVNGQMYVMGGDYGSTGLTAIYALSADGTTWSTKDSMPLGRTRGCAAADGTNIFFYGGAPGPTSAPVNTLFKMDTTKAALSQWTTITPVSGSFTPTPVMNCAAVVVGRKLLIFGGGTAVFGSSPTGLIQSYDIDSNKWDDPTLLPKITARSLLSAVFLKGFVFVIGGSSDGGSNPTPLNKVEIFDVTAKTLSTIADMPTPRYSLGSVTDGSSVFSIGGRTAGGTSFPSLEKLHTP